MSLFNKKYSDTQLIAGIRSGDSKWERIVYKQFQPVTLGFFKKQYSNKKSDLDFFKIAYHETFIAVFKNIRANKYQQKSQFQTYLIDIFKKKCIDGLRKENALKRQQNEDISDFFDLKDNTALTENHLIKKEALAAAIKVLKSIGKNCFEIITKHFEGFTDEEIATQLGLSSKKVVKSRRYTCKEKFKLAIEEKKLDYAF